MSPESQRASQDHVYRHVINYGVEEQIYGELVTAGTEFLDIGTAATGRSALAAQKHGANVTSVEINVEAINEFAASTPNAPLHLAAADMVNLPFARASFDVVMVSLHGFDYVLDPGLRRQAITEAERVLRPGGHFVFNSFNPAGIALSPSSLTDLGFLKRRIGYILSGRFTKPTLIDYNGLELHQATVAAITKEVESQSTLRRKSVRNHSGSNHNPVLVGLFCNAPYYVFQK